MMCFHLCMTPRTFRTQVILEFCQICYTSSNLHSLVQFNTGTVWRTRASYLQTAGINTQDRRHKEELHGCCFVTQQSVCQSAWSFPPTFWRFAEIRCKKFMRSLIHSDHQVNRCCVIDCESWGLKTLQCFCLTFYSRMTHNLLQAHVGPTLELPFDACVALPPPPGGRCWHLFH